MNYKIILGNNIDVLKTYPDNHFDSIVTDPPYGIDFLGKSWDANTGALETYQECLRVLKPGGHLLAFSAARTYHHLAYTLEVAGFEIRDQIMWIYSSGFPKSQDIGRSIQRSLGVKERKQHKHNLPRIGGGEDKTKAWDESSDQGQIVITDPEAKAWEGWGTQLKPAHEPICMARKPIKGSIAANCQQWGTGAINVDACRVGDEIFDTSLNRRGTQDEQIYDGGWSGKEGGELVQGRFPSNVIGDVPDYQKYFYCPKVSRKERHIGFDDDTTMNKHEWLQLVGGKWVAEDGSLHTTPNKDSKMCWLPTKGKIYVHGLRHEVEEILKAQGREDEIPEVKGNNHPTVKPIELMKYLIKLVTPAGGRVLDPFNGSGSTGCAAVELGYEYTGIELDPKYVEIATKRIEAWYHTTHTNTFTEVFEIEH